MQTTMLCRCVVFSTATRWTARPLATPSGRDGRSRVVEQAALEVRIGPGLGDDAGADMRPDLGLVGIDDEVERLGIDIALLGQDRLQRADAELHLRNLGAVVVVMVVAMGVLMDGHAANLPRQRRLGHARATRLASRERHSRPRDAVGLAPPPASGG